MDYLEVIKKLNLCHGPSGDEQEIGQLLKEMVTPYCDECWFDTLGNLVAHRKGSGPKIMFAAHMDSIGLIVTYIQKDGYLRIGKIGGIRPHSILHTPFRFKNGICGVVSTEAKASEKDLSVDDLYLDIGAKDGEEAKTMIQVGDTAVSMLPSFTASSRLISPYLDNRIGCVAMLDAISRTEIRENDLYFVFTVQEELGLRGAKTVTYAINPDYGIAVDITLGDDPDSKSKGSSKLGDGAAIKVMDSSAIYHPQVVKRLIDIAIESDIAYQRDVMTGGRTDAGIIHYSREGVLIGGISIPCRYLHSPVETVDVSDVEACAKLIAAFAQRKL